MLHPTTEILEAFAEGGLDAADGAVVPDLREVSDGLAGELYDWIPRFTKERYEEP